MGHTTRISDYDWDRGDGAKEVPEGYDPRDEKPVTKSKVVEPEDKKPVSTTRTAKTKDVKEK
jgi:hypothetical protein